MDRNYIAMLVLREINHRSLRLQPNPALKRDRPQAAGPLAMRWASCRIFLFCQFAEKRTRRQFLVSAHRAIAKFAQAEPNIRFTVSVQI